MRWLIIGIVVAIILSLAFIYRRKKRRLESFSNPDTPDAPTIEMCPKGTETFITKAGEQLCCEGDVVNGACNGKVRCGLVVRPGSKTQSCSAYVAKHYREQALTFCPKEMPNYWEGAAGRGCTSGSRSADWSSSASGKVCKIYGNEDDSLINKDSCHLHKKLDAVSCPTDKATKNVSIFKTPEGEVPALTCDFLDTNSLPHTCYDNDFSVDTTVHFITKGVDLERKKNPKAYENYNESAIKGVMKEWTKNYVNTCDGAKRYYIDKTLSKADAHF